jgi:cysteine desulfurase/selenocysteine lyase
MFKADFPLLMAQPDLIYLDSAATTQLPRAVIEAQRQVYETSYANPHRGVYTLATQATEAYEQVREQLGRFLGAERPEEIIFTSNATQALHLAASIEEQRLTAGDEIVVSVAEHHSNLLPWYRLAERTGARLRWLELEDKQRLTTASLRSVLSERTKIVAISSVSNVLGAITPLPDIIAAAHAVGARVVVDAAQSIPLLPVNVRELAVDYLALSPHKFYGPPGVGVLYARYSHIREAEPLIAGGGTVATVSRQTATWLPSPQRFEAGTQNLPAVIGVGAALQYLESIGLNTIRRHLQELTTYTLHVLSTIPGLTLYGPLAKRAPIFSFTLRAGQHPLHSHDVCQLADAQRLALRSGHHCAQPLLAALGVTDLTRASLGLYTTRADVDRLGEVLRSIQQRLTAKATIKRSHVPIKT